MLRLIGYPKFVYLIPLMRSKIWELDITKFFMLVLEDVFKGLDWKNNEIKIEEQPLRTRTYVKIFKEEIRKNRSDYEHG